MSPLPSVPPFEADGFEASSLPGQDAETAAFVAAMARDGGATVDLGETGRALCDRAVADTDSYFADGRTKRVVGAWYASRAVRKLATLPKLRALLAAAYGRDAFPFQTINFHRGSQQELHSDTIHFSSLPERFMCGVWIALEDVTPECGPVVYKPGSHRLPILTMRDVGLNSDRPTYEDYDRHYVPAFADRMARSGLPTAPALLKKGEAFVWAANLAHGGAPILDPASTRRSLVVHFYFEDCVYYTPRLSGDQSPHLRLPTNIRTGLWTWPRRNGRRAGVPPMALLAALYRRIIGRPTRLF
jgi:hypothetical protein